MGDFPEFMKHPANRIVKTDQGDRAALRAWLKAHFLPKKLREILIADAPETVPYRRDAEIRRLFDVLGVPIHGVHRFETCTVVELRHP